MSETKHTRGPWRVFNKNGVLAIKSGKGSKNEVVHWSGFDASHFQRQRLANARAIAAAPTMLKMMKAARPILANFCESADNITLYNDFCDAIAKAEGRSP